MSDAYPARLYAAVHDGNSGDLEFYRRRCAGARSIVELGCGDGRVLAALAEPGRALVGVDLDPELLELAAARTIEAGSLELIEGDMREVELDRRFERVIVPHGGLYCLLDEAALAATLRRAAALLTDDGALILDAWAADDFHAEADPDDQDPTWLERVKTVDIDGERYEVLERSAWDKAQQRIDSTYVHVRVGGEEAIEGVLRQRYVLAKQLRSALAEAGLELVELIGDFDQTPYGPESELMVAIARARS